MGKGSKPRPIDVERKVFEDNWDRCFKKRVPPEDYGVVEEVKDDDYLVPDWTKKAGEDDYISKIDLLGTFYGRIDDDV